MVRQSVLFLFLILILASCSGSASTELPEEIANIEHVTVIPDDAEPEYILTPERIAEFGESDDVLIGWLRSVAVDDQGRVFIADSEQEQIHVFQPDGTYITSVGREGDGPGEFRGVTQLRTDSLYLYAKDANSLKLTRFDLETLEYEDAVRFPFDMEGGDGYTHYLDTFFLIDSDRYLIQYDVGYVVGFEDSGQKPDIEGWLLNRETGEYDDGMIYSFRDSETLYRRTEDNIYVMEPPYMRTSNIMQDPEGRMVYGWSEKLLFTFYNVSGEVVEAIYKPHENVVLDPDDVYAIYENHEDPWKTLILEDELPDRWPAYGQAAMDDQGRIWTALFTEDIEDYKWILFDRSGTILASFRWPRSRNIQLLKDGYIYTLERDSETDIRKIVKYGFNL
jgi:hypothetical protein